MGDIYPKPQKSPSVPVNVMDGEIYKSVGKYARGAVLFAFEQMGGPTALTDWAEKNPDEFYTKLFPKIIARESEVTHHKTVDQLMDVIDGDYMIEGDDIPNAEFTPAPVEPIAHNWNTSNDGLLDVDALSDAGFEPDFDPADYADFEE
jgi:hypothetical protein